MDKDKREQMARHFCEMSGHDPDMQVLLEAIAMERQMTPEGVVLIKSPYWRPMWTCYLRLVDMVEKYEERKSIPESVADHGAVPGNEE